MGIALGSINTGLPKNIVEQIIAADKVPLKKMEQKKVTITKKQNLVLDLIKSTRNIKNILSKNLKIEDLRELSVEFNKDLVHVEVDKNKATTGSYRFKILKMAEQSSVMTGGFSDPEHSSVGVGFIQYTLPSGELFETYIDSDHSSLRDVARLINSDPQRGMTAQVVNDGLGGDAPWRILFSLNSTGDEQNAIFPDFYFLDGDEDFFIEFTKEASDAKIMLNGFELEVPGNQIDNLIPGLTLNLKKADPEEEFSIQIKENTQAATEKLSVLVENLNKILKFIKIQNDRENHLNRKNSLKGDLVLRSIKNKITGAIFKPIQTEFGSLTVSSLGIEVQRDGSIKFDPDTFQTQVSQRRRRSSQILSGHMNVDGELLSSGFLHNLNSNLKDLIQRPYGILFNRKTALQSNIDQIDRKIIQKENFIKQKEDHLKNKFAKLEGTIAKIKSQGQGLARLG